VKRDELISLEVRGREHVPASRPDPADHRMMARARSGKPTSGPMGLKPR